MKGIDVSSHNGSIDWNKVKDAGIGFAILRAGYGKHASQQDSRFTANAAGTLGAGIACGAYWFSYALTPDEAREEAQLCARVLEPYKGKFLYPVYFDYEYDSERYSAEHGVTPHKELRTQLAVRGSISIYGQGGNHQPAEQAGREGTNVFHRYEQIGGNLAGHSGKHPLRRGG